MLFGLYCVFNLLNGFSTGENVSFNMLNGFLTG